MKSIKYILITIITLSSTLAHAGFGWFVFGAMMGSSTTNKYQQTAASPIYITMKQSNHCKVYGKTSAKEELNKVAISLNLIQTVKEYKSTQNGKTCLSFIVSSSEGNLYYNDVVGALEDFQTTIANIKSTVEDKNKK